MDDGLANGGGVRFARDAEERTLRVAFDAQAGPVAIDDAALGERLAELGCGDWRVAEAARAALLAHARAGTAMAPTVLAQSIDATLTLTLSADGSSATLSIAPAQGGTAVTKEAVLAGLAERGVSYGIELDAVNGAIAAGVADGVVIARGRPPVPGIDGRLECLVSEVRDRRPRLDASGHIDYRELGDIQVVREGEALMRRHLPTEGEVGITVTGQPVAPRAGRAVAFAPGLKGAAPSPDDPDLLVATLTGQPVRVRGGMQVEPVYDIDAVGMASGNIRFDGNVKIRGDVAAGMVVEASGDIEVGGVVESATLEAGGNIVIKGGAIGRLGRKEPGEPPRMRCGASFTAAYAQQVRVEAGDSIFIDDIAMQCELIAANHILIGQRRRGQVIGGYLQAALSVRAKVLGSPNRIETRFEIGTPPEVHREQLELARQRDGKETQLLDLSRLLNFAAQHPERLPPATLDKARTTVAALSAEIAALRVREQAITQAVELARKARVVAEKAMYDGVIVGLGTHRYRVQGEHGAGAIGLGDDGLELMTQEG